ncbi:MAG: nucleotide exchange factor GrpE [Kiritimatiellia bacterium]
MMKRKDENGNSAKHAEAPSQAENATTAPQEEAEAIVLPVDVGPEAAPSDGELEASITPKLPSSPEQRELVQLKDRLLRLQADFDNFRKRTNRERADIQKRACEAVLTDLIPILDNLEFGLQQAAAKPGAEVFADGLRLIQSQLVETLRKHGLEGMNAVGCEFDPQIHEAMAYAPSNEMAEGRVVAQTRRGYKVGERLARAAMVVVSSGPPAPVAPAGDLSKGGGN